MNREDEFVKGRALYEYLVDARVIPADASWNGLPSNDAEFWMNAAAAASEVVEEEPLDDADAAQAEEEAEATAQENLEELRAQMRGLYDELYAVATEAKFVRGKTILDLLVRMATALVDESEPD